MMAAFVDFRKVPGTFPRPSRRHGFPNRQWESFLAKVCFSSSRELDIVEKAEFKRLSERFRRLRVATQSRTPSRRRGASQV